MRRQFDSHTNLHHSQTSPAAVSRRKRFDSHTNLHHSQTIMAYLRNGYGLTPILIYIILKPGSMTLSLLKGLTPILIYIILKR